MDTQNKYYLNTHADSFVHLHLHTQYSILDGAMKLNTTSQVQRFMTQQLERVAPQLAILETG